MSLVRQFRWAVSNVGIRRASNEFERIITIDSMIGEGWKVLDQRAWKTGASGATEPWAKRARKANLITVWRSFEQARSDRWLWVQVTDLASDVDAEAALSVAPDRLLRNIRADVKVTSDDEIEPIPIEGQRAAWALEQATIGPRGEGVSLYLAFVIDSSLVALGASGIVDSLTWEELHGVATAQVDLL